MSNKLSISQRLSKTRRVEVKKEILFEWLDSFSDDMDAEIKNVSSGYFNNDRKAIFAAAIHLQAMREKRLKALKKIFARIESMK